MSQAAEVGETLRRMQALTQRIWQLQQRFHVGDLVWDLRSVPGSEESAQLAVWSEGGVDAAWGWIDPPGYLELMVDPSTPHLLDPLLNWFEESCRDADLACTVMSADRAARDALAHRGFTVQEDAPFSRRLVRNLDDLPQVSLPPGYRLRSVGPDDAERRAAVHRLGWSDFGSRVSTESYSRIMSTPPYRSETDLVVVAPDGEWVASALGWYDEVNGVGLVEPVSCAPEHRGRGLATAVDAALLGVFSDLGACTAVVLPRGDDAYPGPMRLYRSIGYQPGDRSLLYTRPVG